VGSLPPCPRRHQSRRRPRVDNDAYSFLSALRRRRCIPASGGNRRWPPNRLYEVVPGIYQSVVSTSPTSPSSRATPASLLSTHWCRPSGGRGTGSVSNAPRRRSPCRRGDIHPQPRRSFRRRAGRHVAGGRGQRRSRGAGTRGIRRTCGAGERLCRSAMTRRATYMYAPCWRADARPVGCGSGRPRPPRGGRHRPDLDIRTTGETHHRRREIEFQMAPGTEAPAEMHFYFRVSGLCAWPRTPRITYTTC